MATYDSDETDESRRMDTAKRILGLWQVWLLGIAMTGLFAFAVLSPAMGEGYFYEAMFGVIALVAFGYGIRELTSSPGYGS